MANKIPNPTESQEQQALFSWAAVFERTTPELGLLYHIPNGGKRSAATAARLKAEGVKPGVPDICLPVARGGYHGLYIELKRVDTGKPTKYQGNWITRLNDQGYCAVICYGWKDASEVILNYLERNRH